MYDGAVASVRAIKVETYNIPITIGLHQGSALSPYQFALVIGYLKTHSGWGPVVYFICRRYCFSYELKLNKS